LSLCRTARNIFTDNTKAFRRNHRC
jgi:hypothetical protein